MTTDDMELVRQFASQQSESAFAALVLRHANLVYSVALRQVRDPQLAEEITQAVFIILAQKAGSLNEKTILPGWLYRAACYTSKNARKREYRRQQREQEAYIQSTLQEAGTDVVWKQMSPLLEEAMLRLGQTDRDALVLRFFEGRSLNEVGIALGASEDAAKKRVNRALEKLRKFFTKRGVSSTTAIIAGTISANSVQAAPVALAKAVTAIAVAKGAAASGSTLTLIKGALKIMAWTKMKMTIGVVAAVVLVATASVIVNKVVKNNRPPPKLETRAFKVTSNIFIARKAKNPTPNASTTKIVADFFASKGMSFQPPKLIFYSDQSGALFVKATSSDLNAVEKIIQQLASVPPQVHSKIYFIKVSEGDVESILKAGTVVDTKERKNIVEIMSANQTPLLLRKFRSVGATTLSEPEVVTTAGRQAQMSIADTIVDLVPILSDDGYTLKMTVIVRAPENLFAKVNAWDGQTIILAPNNSNDGKTRLLVLVTTALIDSAGNLIHPNNELPFNSSAIPPQE